MKRITAGLFVSALLTAVATSAHAQNTTKVVGTCGTATYTAGKMAYPTQDTTGVTCTSSSSSGGGAVTIADGADVTQGHIADATVLSGASGTIASYLRTIKDAAVSTSAAPVKVDQTTPGTTNNVTVSTNAIASAPTIGIIQATASSAISTTAAGGPTQLIAASGSTKIYVTNYTIVFSGAGTFAWVTGTGTNCGTNTAYLTGASGHPMSFAANGGVATGSGLGPILITGAGGELCYITTGSVDISGSVAYAQF